MIPNHKVADVLDGAAKYLLEHPLVPDSPANVDDAEFDGPNGEPGHDARAAIMHAMDDLELLDQFEGMAGFPHEALISEFVADTGNVPEQDPAVQTARFEGKERRKIVLADVPRQQRRRDDLLQWARGRSSAVAAAIYVDAATELRRRPADEGMGALTEAGVFNVGAGPQNLDELLAMLGAVPGGIAGAMGIDPDDLPGLPPGMFD